MRGYHRLSFGALELIRQLQKTHTQKMNTPIIYKKFSQLNGKTLKAGDAVILHGILLTVSDNGRFLSDSSSMGNATIFKLLGLGVAQTAKSVYGKDADMEGSNPFEGHFGKWPETKDGCFEALTRMCLVLMAFVEGSPWVEIKVDGVTVRVVNNNEALEPLPYPVEPINNEYIATLMPNGIFAKSSFQDPANLEATLTALSKPNADMRNIYDMRLWGYVVGICTTPGCIGLGCQIVPIKNLKSILKKWKKLYGDK